MRKIQFEQSKFSYVKPLGMVLVHLPLLLMQVSHFVSLKKMLRLIQAESKYGLPN